MRTAGRYFSPDYFTARDRFRDAAAQAGGRLHALPLSAAGPGGEPLSIDIAWFGAERPGRLLLHSSGLHGVEGFAGAAIQLQLLDDLPPFGPGAALVIVHILNPYGMAWLQRVNENNVDLNRNFRTSAAYRGAPPGYANLDWFLNPRTPPSFDFYLAKAAWLVFRHGLTNVKQAVAGGQCEYPKGLFFGGKRMEEGPQQYQSFVKERVSAASRAVVIDVHTGLGKFGEDLQLVATEDYVRLRPILGDRVTPLQPEGGSAYRIEGGLETMIFESFSKTRPIFIGQEFGTYSSVKVLHALREENRWRQYGAGALDHPAKQNLKRVFCPDDPSWRHAVLKRGRKLIDAALRL